MKLHISGVVDTANIPAYTPTNREEAGEVLTNIGFLFQKVVCHAIEDKLRYLENKDGYGEATVRAFIKTCDETIAFANQFNRTLQVRGILPDGDHFSYMGGHTEFNDFSHL